MTRVPRAAAAALLVLLAGACGCARVPRVIVLEDPLSAAEHLDLGVAYERKGELDLAMREYGMAAKKDGRLAAARANMGNVLLAQGRYADARREYLRALEIDGADVAAANNLAWVAIRSGKDVDGELARMERLLADPGRRTAPLLDTLGVLRARAGRAEAALAAFREAEEACDRGAAGRPGGECTEEVRREIAAHRAEAAAPIRPPAGPAPLVK